MPELPVKEIRLPELHLPEISREEILRTVSEVRRPDLDLRRVELPKVEMRAVSMPRIRSMRMPKIDMPKLDLANFIASAIAAIGIVRPRKRSRFQRYRWGVVAGLVVAAGAAAVIVSRRQAARQQIEGAARTVGTRLDGMRGQTAETLEFDADDAMATGMSIGGTTGIEETNTLGATNGTGIADVSPWGEAINSDEPAELAETAAATDIVDVESEPVPAVESTSEPGVGEPNTATESENPTSI
jgi:hypothetical protein